MRDLMINLFGIYQPVQFVTSAGETIIPAGASGVDWVYISGILLFALSLYCVYRMIGGIFNAVFRH